MKLVHLTAKRFESLSADNIYIRSLAEHFSTILGHNYLLVARSMAKGQFMGINTLNLNLLSWGTGLAYFLLPYFIYFLWLPYFLLFKAKTDDATFFFSSDPHILWILILWRKILFLNFKITSDWHMLHNDWKDKFIARNSDYLISTSEKLKRMLVAKTGVPEEKIAVIYGGVEFESFGKVDMRKVREEYNLPQDKKLVGYIGLFKTMGMEKGIKTVIESIKYWKPELTAVFVGGKPSEIEEYSRLAGKAGVGERCVFVEKISERKEIYKVEQAMDALLIPYPDQPHFRNYGFPMKAYEYMAARKPVIYSRLELAEEVLSDCGFTFAPDNPESLASTLEFVFSEENKREVEDKVALAYEKSGSFTWENKARKIIEFQEKNG